MRILFLSPYVPHPVRLGGHNRTLGMIRCLARFGSVHVLSIGDPADAGLPEARRALAADRVAIDVHPATGPGPEEAEAENLDRLPDAACHFRSPSLAAALDAHVAAMAPDLAVLEELVMAQYAERLACPRVVDRQKIEWAYHDAMAAAGGADAAWHRREAARFRRWEASLTPRMAAVLVTGPVDAALIAPVHGAERVHVVPIGVDDALTPGVEPRGTIDHVLLYGALDYGPNVEANATYFREIWPRLAAAAPGLRTVVVGSGRPPETLPRDDPRVTIRGFVADVVPILRAPGVLVVPLRVGGGSRTKILEGMAAGMPVVSASAGVDNLGLEPGVHFLLAETAADTVEAVLRLMREPDLATSLGRAGAARIAAEFRWDVVGRRLETVCRGVVGSARAGWTAEGSRPAPRALLVGVHPLPEDSEARHLSFPGHRTAQFAHALRAAACEVVGVLLDEEGGGTAELPGAMHVLAPEAFRAGRQLQSLHDRLRPDVVVAAGGYHPARVVAQLRTDAPRYIDLPGDLAAEAQLRAESAGDEPLRDALAVLAGALAAGDRFSVVGASQRLAVLGQLGLVGRLSGSRVGDEPVDVVPLAVAGPEEAPPLSDGGFEVLWAGGYNTWMDVETLAAGVEEAMSRRDDVVFAATGGAVPDHEQERHDLFWRKVRAGRFPARFCDHGRLPRAAALERLSRSNVVVCIARPCLEAELGSRLRVVEALAYGRPVVVTALGDLADEIGAAGAGLLVPPGDAAALAGALVRLAEDRALLRACAERARALWTSRFTREAATEAVTRWARQPSHWPAPAVGEPAAADPERFRLQAELDAMRGSRTFRALRLLDRLTGRSGRSR
jgi:glycosyltransferase involved in cell wall biosynthesis